MKWTLVILLSSLSTGHQIQGCSVTAKVGETVILPVKVDLAQDAKLSIPTITWENEANKLVHYYRSEHDYNEDQIKRFKGRTSLFNEEIKERNVSLKIINVTKHDAGNYTCEVLHKDPDIEKTYKVSLCVTEKGEKTQDRDPTESTDTEHKPALGPVIVLIVLGVLIGFAAPAALCLYKKLKEAKGKAQGAGGDDQEMDKLTGGDPGAGGNKPPTHPPEDKNSNGTLRLFV